MHCIPVRKELIMLKSSHINEGDSKAFFFGKNKTQNLMLKV